MNEIKVLYLWPTAIRWSSGIATDFSCNAEKRWLDFQAVFSCLDEIQMKDMPTATHDTTATESMVFADPYAPQPCACEL
ncbi:hypothetical protein [Denitratisoma sp. agr-D3]